MSPASEARPNPRPNPYVGPRAFRYGERLYGRDREALELLDLLIAERIVLLYSPSGAGKTSLIQAALVPELEEREGFTVPPVARVSLVAPSSETGTANRYVLSVLLSLEGDLDEAEQLPIGELSRMALADYLEHRPELANPPGGVAFIFDQFEEVLTLNPTDTAEKEAFFDQLGAVLRSQDRWALFAMREEHVAGLDPYRRFLPTRLDNTYRLELLNDEQGKLAMQRPAKAAGVDFTDAAARKLVDDLRRVRVQRQDGTVSEQPGPFIEPVQLQVICQNLWRALADDDMEIGEDDVAAHGDVDKVLADYYAEQVAWAASETGTGEAVLRRWIQEQMITAQGLRTQILKEDAKQSRGMDNEVVRALVDAHLVREERRRGLTWFELAHDRLVEPIRQNNGEWLEAHLSVLQRQAMLWHGQGRPQHLELRGQQLTEAVHWAATHPGEMTEVEQAFLSACLKRRAEERRVRRLRTGVYISLLALPVGIIIATFYTNALQNQPWGRLDGLFDGSVHYLATDKVSLGRSTDVITADVSSFSRFVSRMHMYITDKSIAVDMRSLNGTTINAKLLPYGEEAQLSDHDLIGLAGVELYRFLPLEYSWFPFMRGKPADARRADAAWGFFVDGNSRSAIPLVQSHYFVKLDSDNSFSIDTEDTGDVLLEFGLDSARETWMEDRADGLDLIVEYKEGDYDYKDGKLESTAYSIFASGSYRYGDNHFQIVLSSRIEK